MNLPKPKGKRGKRPIRPAFRTSKQLGLREGEIPFKFRVEIDPLKDDGAEVSRKKALLRLNSQRVYMQMGCVAKAHVSMAEAAKWLGRLHESMDEEDRQAAAPLIAAAGRLLGEVERLARQKTDLAVRMEEAGEREWKHARAAWDRLAKAAANKSRKAKEFGLLALTGPVDVPGDASRMAESMRMLGVLPRGRG